MSGAGLRPAGEERKGQLGVPPGVQGASSAAVAAVAAEESARRRGLALQVVSKTPAKA